MLMRPLPRLLLPRYTKRDGKVWFYHKPTGKMQWNAPDEWPADELEATAA